MVKRYRVTLTPDERAALERRIGGGKAARGRWGHARILLQAGQAGGGPGRGGRGVGGGGGGRAGGAQGAGGRAAPAGAPGGGGKATQRGGPPAAIGRPAGGGQARPDRAVRLRVRAERDVQPVHRLRAP